MIYTIIIQHITVISRMKIIDNNIMLLYRQPCQHSNEKGKGAVSTYHTIYRTPEDNIASHHQVAKFTPDGRTIP